jgi:hypothetical protein
MSWRTKGAPFEPGPHSWERWRGYKRRWGGYVYRHMRTTQEIRSWDDAYGRRARSPRQLPDFRDDIVRFLERSWKAHRRTQYRPGS